MGIQSSGDSRISEFEKTLRRVQAELAELKKAKNHRADDEDSHGTSHSSGSGPRRRARYRLSSESDDDEDPPRYEHERGLLPRVPRALRG